MDEDIKVRTVAPKLGEHNAAVFGTVGVSEAELKALREKGVV
jgi:crotonobetainyl-CoA:carnitine CoA-transferase CaiB-like acyl-CoA transferase